MTKGTTSKGKRHNKADLNSAEIATTNLAGKPLLNEHEHGDRVGTVLASWQGRDGSLRIAANVEEAGAIEQVKKGALRGVARRDLTHTLVLNAAPAAVDAHGDKAVRFMAATSEMSADTFLVRVKTKDDRASLLAVLAPEKATA